jgi:hypothetical protein
MVWLRILIITGLCLLTACQKTGPNDNNWLGNPSSGDFSIAHLRRELKPLVACVKPNLDGSFTAYFGYQNTTGKTITLPVGEKNKFLENPGRESNFDNNEDHYNDAHNDRDKRFSTKSTQNRDDDNKKERDKNKERDHDREDEHQNNRRDYQDRGQPTVFPVGNSPAWPNNPLAIRFNAERISWKLDQQTVTAYADDSSQRCKIEQIAVPQQTTVRKNILPAQTLRITQRNSSTHTLSFNLNETADLKRRILVNIFNGPNGSPRVNQAQIFVNKQPLNINLNTQTPDNIKQVFTAHSGTNTLEIELNGVTGSSIQVSIEGLMDPIYIPGAMFSDIPDSSVIRAMEHNKHLVGLKFMEGMRVRIQNSASGNQEFTDLTGISLTPLNRLLPSLNPRLIYPALSKSPEEQEQTEIRTQNFFGVETINTSLMYQLEFSAEQDVWTIIDQLRQLPFIEEAFPTILPVQASDTSTPDDEYLKSTHSYIENSDGPTRPALSLTYHTWLRNTRVMSDPVAGTDGSWLYTKGNPNVKIAVLDSGIQHQGLKGVAKTHEDFFNKQGINPIQVLSNLQQDKIPSEYTHLAHGTPAVGIISAQGNNKIGNAALAKGTAGIAYEAKMIFVQSNGEYTNPAKPKERIGIPANCLNRYSVGKPEYCEPIADAMELLQQRHPDIKVIVLENWSGIGTAEILNPAIRGIISDFVSAGIAVVVAFYDPNNSGPITARAGEVIGFFVQNARTRNISIEIQGKNAVITANHDDLLSMTVPADLIVGNVDATFKSDEGEFKIENLINYTSPFPEVVKFSKPTIFANGGDVVDAYITVKDAKWATRSRWHPLLCSARAHTIGALSRSDDDSPRNRPAIWRQRNHRGTGLAGQKWQNSHPGQTECPDCAL